MRNPIRLIPGGLRVLVITLPVLIGLGALTAAYEYAQSNRQAGGTQLPNLQNLDVPPPSGLLVDINGAVNHPGLYRMKRGDRVYDVIAAAGGLTDQADLTRLPDLAGRLKDAEQVKVPLASSTAGNVVIPRTNLNAATIDELEVLPGLTTAFAQDVIDYRTNFGGFQNIREMVEVLGMSEAEFLIARRYLTL